MLSWLVIGAGIHGVRIAHSLLVERRVPRERLRLVDPGPAPLFRWRQSTKNARIRFLRSPSVHHLGLGVLELEDFAREQRVVSPFQGSFQKPSRALFDAHSLHLVDRLRLEELHVRAAVSHLRRIEGGWRAESRAGPLESRRVVLALGRTGLALPEAFSGIAHRRERVRHLYGADPIDEAFLGDHSVAVLGLGLGAAECALSLSKAHRGRVALMARHDVRRSTLDVKPGWGDNKKARRRLARAAEPLRRRALIERSRKPGSIPPLTADELLTRARGERLAIRRGSVESARIADDGAVEMTLGDGTIERAERVILATGFERSRPGGQLVEALIDEHSLPTAPCGFPWLSDDLQWGEGLFVTGSLAELTLGPQAPNIVGAAMAAQRIRHG